MTTPDSPSDPLSGTSPEADRVVADIEATRAELGSTVDALAAKLDVRAQARNRIDETRERAGTELTRLRAAATDDRGRPTATTVGVAGALVAAVVAVAAAVVRRRRRR